MRYLFTLAQAFLFLAPSLAQSIHRDITAIQTETLTDSVTPATGSQFSLDGGSITARAGVPIPDDDGVNVHGIYVRGEIYNYCTIRVRGLNSGGTILTGGGYNALAACGASSCNWGPSDFFGNSFPFSEGTNQPIPQGDTRTIELWNGMCGVSSPVCVIDMQLSPGDFSWQAALNDPNFQTLGAMSSLSFSAFDPAGQATSVELQEFSLNSYVTSEFRLGLELLPAPLTTYCTSPAGASGSTATLSAFGSQQTLTEYLTVRASGIGDGNLSMLLVGTEAGDRPLGFANICVGGAITREGGLVVATGGSADFHIDLMNRHPGDTVYLQVLHRDPSAPFVASEAARFTVLPR